MLRFIARILGRIAIFLSAACGALLYIFCPSFTLPALVGLALALIFAGRKLSENY